MFNRPVLAISALLALALLPGCGSSHHTAYVTTPLNNGIAAFRVDNHTGKLGLLPGSPFQAGLSPVAIVVDPAGKFAYVANGGGNDISLFKIQSTFGLIEVMPRTPTRLNPSSLAMDPAGKLLFVTNSGSNNVSVFSIDSTTGALSEVTGSPYAVGFNPVFVKVSPSGKYLYVANSAGNTISAFTIDSSGTLTQIPGSPYVLTSSPTAQSAGPNWIAIDPNEQFLYVANLLSSNISGFTIDSNTGALTIVNGAPFTAGTSPSSLVFGPTGQFLYVVNLTSNGITPFALDKKGVPTKITSTDYPTGANPIFIVLDVTNTYLLVGSRGGGSIGTFSINSSSGQLVPLATTGIGSAPTSISAFR